MFKFIKRKQIGMATILSDLKQIDITNRIEKGIFKTNKKLF